MIKKVIYLFEINRLLLVFFIVIHKTKLIDLTKLLGDQKLLEKMLQKEEEKLAESQHNSEDESENVEKETKTENKDDKDDDQCSQHDSEEETKTEQFENSELTVRKRIIQKKDE